MLTNGMKLILCVRRMNKLNATRHSDLPLKNPRWVVNCDLEELDAKQQGFERPPYVGDDNSRFYLLEDIFRFDIGIEDEISFTREVDWILETVYQYRKKLKGVETPKRYLDPRKKESDSGIFVCSS